MFPGAAGAGDLSVPVAWLYKLGDNVNLQRKFDKFKLEFSGNKVTSLRTFATAAKNGRAQRFHRRASTVQTTDGYIGRIPAAVDGRATHPLSSATNDTVPG